MIRCREPLYRPPAEAGSLILQAAYGCAHNRCTFCGMYKGVRYQVRPEAELFGEISEAARLYPETRRVFLADGNALGLGYDRLRPLLERLAEAFPRLARINLYANCRSIAALTDGELTGLRRLKLNTLYTGLESGSQRVLDLVHKGESAAETVRQVRRAEAAGFTCSVMVLVGLGGQSYSEEHADATAAALNLMRPTLLSALRVIPPGVLFDGFRELTEYQAVGELHRLIGLLELERTVFRADHPSNPAPLAGRFPQDKYRLLVELEATRRGGLLDRDGPGRRPFAL